MNDLPSMLSGQRRLALAACIPLTLAGAYAHAAQGLRTLPNVTVTAEAEPADSASVGGKTPQARRDIPHSVSVVDEQRIREQNLDGVAQALNAAAPGVTLIANDSTQSQIRARGYAMGVTLDGMPAYSALSGYQQFDLALFERLEVLRGPAGLFTGSGDPGGVVNLVRKKPRAEFVASTQVALGSWNNRRVVADVTGALNATRTLTGRMVFAGVDRDYFYDKTHTRRWMAYAAVDWALTAATRLSFSAAVQDDDTDSPASGLPAWSTGELMKVSRRHNPIADWSRYRWQTRAFTAELQHEFDNGWQAKAVLSHRPQDFYFKDGYATSGVDVTTGTLNYARRVRDYDYGRDGLDLFVTGPLELFGRRHTLLAGYNRERFTSTYDGVNAPAVTGIPFGSAHLVPDFDLPYTLGGESETEQSGFYGQARVNVTDRLDVVLGGRWSDFRTKSRDVPPATPSAWRPGARADDEFTPYGAVMYRVHPHWTAYYSWSDIFIPQTQQRVDGSTLDPRSGAQSEFGVKADLLDKRLHVAASYFRLRDTNRAYADPDNTGYFLAAGEVESKGWELEVSGEPAPGYSLQLGYTRLDTRYLKDRNNQGLPFTTWEPRHTLKLWGVRRFTEGSLHGLSVGLGVNAVSGSKAGNGTSAVRRQGGYALVNAMLSYPLGERTSLSLHLNNLTDRHYYTRLGGLNTYNTYGEPRTASLVLRVEL